jgi:hypothetical protein
LVREDNQASDLIASCISLCSSDCIIHQNENFWGLACSLWGFSYLEQLDNRVIRILPSHCTAVVQISTYREHFIDSVFGQMPPLLNQLCDLLELSKVALLLRREKAEPIKERDYVLDDRGEIVDFVVLDAVCPGPHRSALQLFLEHSQNCLIALGHVEAQRHFPRHRIVDPPSKGHIEAAFTVSESS